MKNMRFFALALLVAGAYATNETCGDADGDAAATDAYACPQGYTAKGGADNVSISANNNGAVEAANTALCCDANQVDFTGDANSDETGTTAIVVDATPLTVTCNAGYESGGNPSYDVGINAAGDALTGNGTPCAAKTFQSSPLIAGSNYATAQTVTFGATPTAFACDAAGYSIAKKANGTDDADVTVTVDATTGAVFTYDPDTLDETTICVGATYATVTPGGLGLIKNSNYKADVSVTVGQALAAFACETGFELNNKKDGTTAITVTLGAVTATDGSFDITTDDDNDTTFTGDNLCKAAPAPAPASTPAAGSAGSAGSVADSATDSSASPAALAAAGMAAIALLL